MSLFNVYPLFDVAPVKAKDIFKDIDPINSTLLIAQAKKWIDKENYELWKHKINNAMPELKKAFGSEKIARKYSNAFLEYLKNEETTKL